MSSDYKEILEKLRRDMARGDVKRGGKEGIPGSPEERDAAAISRYERMKHAAATGDFVSAREHASNIEQLRPSDKSIRVLTGERLKLLSRRPRNSPLPSHFNPGTVRVDGLGSVPVLGRYEARGAQGRLTSAILLLKKAPQELDDASLSARPNLIDRLGLLMWDVLAKTHSSQEVDLVVPVPPIPEGTRRAYITLLNPSGKHSRGIPPFRWPAIYWPKFAQRRP